MKLENRYLLLLVIFFLFPVAVMADNAGIQVSGTAKVTVVPDMATFTFAIEGRGQDLPIVKSDIDMKTARLVHLCKSLEIDAKKITATEVSIRPQYNYQNKTFLGYNISRTVNVTLDKLSQYSQLVNGAIDAGITTIRSIVIDSSERDDLQRKALESAVQDAASKARIVARGAGVHLGKVLSVKEGGVPMESSNYRLLSLESARVDNASVIEPGEISITATVVVNFAID